MFDKTRLHIHQHIENKTTNTRKHQNKKTNNQKQSNINTSKTRQPTHESKAEQHNINKKHDTNTQTIQATKRKHTNNNQ